ncbi:MAG: hypothetical protein NT140_04355 [Deltaproteobacteria bacterium]|nr:hypothetical protein [Deltaproteobacteria bacterium]
MKTSFYPGMQISDTAVGEESDELSRAYETFVRDFFVPISRESLFPFIKFYRLKSQWEAETTFLSSLSDIAMHPAYQQIIGMGPVVIPLILREMKKEPGHWFWALKSITGDDPVPPENRGKIKAMTEDWLIWGKEQGYIN